MQLLYKKGSYHISYTSQYYCRSQTFLLLMLTFTIFIIFYYYLLFFCKTCPCTKKQKKPCAENYERWRGHNTQFKESNFDPLVVVGRLLSAAEDSKTPRCRFLSITRTRCPKMAWHNMQTVIKYQTEKDIATVTPKRE